jgi:hypothetical protein
MVLEKPDQEHVRRQKLQRALHAHIRQQTHQVNPITRLPQLAHQARCDHRYCTKSCHVPSPMLDGNIGSDSA